MRAIATPWKVESQTHSDEADERAVELFRSARPDEVEERDDLAGELEDEEGLTTPGTSSTAFVGVKLLLMVDRWLGDLFC